MTSQLKIFQSVKSKKEIYLGIEILRMILSFFIVVVHFFDKRNAKTKLLLFPFQVLPYYIPTFFIISFYFNYKTFASRNIAKIKERFLRILIPYYIWPTIFFIRYHIFNYANGIIENDKLKNLYYQYLIGDGFHGVFWFQFNLIFISLFIVIIIFLIKSKNLLIIIIIGIIVLIFEFYRYIYNFFLNYNHPINHSVSNIPSSFIYSISGFILGYYNILNYLIKSRIKIFLIFLFSFYLIKGIKNILFIRITIFKIDFISIGYFYFLHFFPLTKSKII